MPEQKHSYIFCQYISPALAHKGGRCDCNDIKSLLYCKEHRTNNCPCIDARETAKSTK